MRFLVTAEEMRLYDAYTIEQVGIPAMVLMERAALSVREYIMGLAENKPLRGEEGGRRSDGLPRRVLVMAGTGNNGGDGLALARLLAAEGISVDVWRVGDETKASVLWRQQKSILEHYGVEICDDLPAREYAVLADALFGVGISREVTGRYAEAIKLFNEKKGYKLALDVPSGIDCDTGRVLGCAVKADATVTFGYAKRGLYLHPGAGFAGRLRIADIGIVADPGREPGMFCIPSAGEAGWRRDPAGNKGTFGKVLLVAGAEGMAGAAVLAAKAAYRVGAGMVRVLTVPENRVILQETVPEALYGTADSLARDLEWADVVVAGPGLGREAAARGLLEQVILNSEKPVVIDADGLNMLAEDSGLQGALAGQRRAKILTPHVGELARLLGKNTEDLKDMLWEHGAELAERLHAVVVAKDARTFICREGRPVCMNVLGNSGMATAGSGDVLAGAIGGILGQLVKSRERAAEAGESGRTVYGAAEAGESGRTVYGAAEAGESGRTVYGAAEAGESGRTVYGAAEAGESGRTVYGAAEAGESGRTVYGAAEAGESGRTAYRAACIGVTLHAAAGDRVAALRGEHACMAGDIADALGDVISGEPISQGR